MFEEGFSKYRRALVLGTGGGNDIVSAIIPALQLQKLGIETDIAGILSPGAVHTFDKAAEKVVNRIDGRVRRYIPGTKSIEISFMDALLPGIAKKLKIPIPNFYDISIRYGTQSLIDGVNALAAERGYDLVVAVDVGGDILARGPQDEHVKSPLMDLSTLYLLRNLRVDSFLVEFGLGTDGELRPGGIEEILAELKESGIILQESTLNPSDSEVNVFRDVFSRVRKVRPGHTAVMTLETLDTPHPDKDIVKQYKSKYHLGKRTWEVPYEVTLPHQYFGKVFLMKGNSLAFARLETAFSYGNPLEQFVNIKRMAPTWKTELDLLYLWSEDTWKNPSSQGQLMLLLVPSLQVPEHARKEILAEGFSMLKTGMVDVALVLDKDRKNLPDGLYSVDAGPFAVVNHKRTYFVEQTAQEVARYCK